MRNAAYFIASQSESSGASFLQSAFRSVQRAVKAWTDRRAVSRLVDFDDHLLSDLGLTRNDVRAALDLPFSSDPGRELQIRASHNIRSRWGV
jgi:uncharacterized protein YjiS (DUF1127 family)